MRFMYIVTSPKPQDPRHRNSWRMHKLATGDQGRPHARQWRTDAGRHRRAGENKPAESLARRWPVCGDQG